MKKDKSLYIERFFTGTIFKFGNTFVSRPYILVRYITLATMEFIKGFVTRSAPPNYFKILHAASLYIYKLDLLEKSNISSKAP